MDYLADLEKIRVEYKLILEKEREDNSSKAHLDSQQDEQLFAQYTQRLASLRAIYPSLPVAKPRPLTIPAIFRRTYDENFLSDYLAYILNPEKNGLGLIPLKALLKFFLPENELPEMEEVIVRREYPLDGSRIDLLIEIDRSMILGIENKIYAGESPHQTSSYAHIIKREFSGYKTVMIYLTPRGNKAQSSEFQSLSYKKILDAFREIH